ncbi:MAG TPA: trimeric intracellular cation channel family protein [Anaerolineaceae bacterium]
MSLNILVVALDLIGTLVFAVSGAAEGVKHRLDLFGVLVLSFAAATSGGLVRDVLIGSIPPAAISDLRYIFVPVVAGLVVFWAPKVVDRLRYPVLLFDAAGLALFVISGTYKALSFNLNPAAAVILGVLTGIGGGIVRDLLVQEIPAVLRREIYAVAGLAGALVVVVGHHFHLPPTAVAIVAAVLCFGLRMVSLRRHWQLPIAKPVQ